MDNIQPPEAFRTTRWTRVIAARGESGDERDALKQLAADYYAPVVAFLARDGRSPDDAREMAHAFFADFLAGDFLSRVDPGKGRFRSYLLGSLKHFMAHCRERSYRLKRGAGAEHIPLEFGTESSPALQESIADISARSPDHWFDRQWALTVLQRALTASREQAVREGRERQFIRLQPWLTGEADHGDQKMAAADLGMSAGAVKVAIHRMRGRFRNAVRDEVGRTLDDGRDLEEEMRALYAALG